MHKDVHRAEHGERMKRHLRSLQEKIYIAELTLQTCIAFVRTHELERRESIHECKLLGALQNDAEIQ